MDEQRPPSDVGDHERGPERPSTASDVAGLGRRAGRRRHRGGTDRRRPDVARGVTTAAVVVATAAGAGALAIVAGTLTLVGWGVAVVVAILAVGVAAAIHPRPANGWILIPVLALALPAAAVAISGVRVSLDRGRVVEAPASVSEIPPQGYHAGLGDLLVDLRHLDAEDDDEIVIRAGSDLGRTHIALPQEQCFHLDVRWRTGTFRLPRVQERPTVRGLRPGRPLFRLGQQSPRNRKRFGTADGRIALFGRAYAIDEGRWVAPSIRDAPKLTLELSSEGGSFVVRSYPDNVSPLNSPAWPIDQWPPPNLDYTGPGFPEYKRARPDPKRIGIVSGVYGEGPLADHMRRNVRRRQDFARRWARRVTGTCNPTGTFR